MEKEQLYDILLQMTLEEKLGQLTQSTGEHFVGKIDGEMVETGPDFSQLKISQENLHMMGSVLGASSAKVVNAIQKNYLAKSRLKIPLMFMHDAIHGYETIYPIPLALSCSWDFDLVKEVSAYIAKELRVSGIQVNFSPMTDLVRDARWGRVMESFGEDHILSGDLGRAMIEGYQGGVEGIIGAKSVVACLKHFAAYGASEAGVDYAAVDMSMREFFGYYGRPYEIALKANPRMVMSSFNSFNGEPVTASKKVLQDILRGRYGFTDLIISDWGAVIELVNHGTAADESEAAHQALHAGVDIEMTSTTYLRNGEEIISNNPELLAQIDEAVLKVLTLKNDLGLFEQPYVDEKEEAQEILSKEQLEMARKAAEDSCVLLKNEHVLPFNKAVQKVLVVGPYAKSKELLGNWLCKGSFDNVVSLEDGIKQVLPQAEVWAFESIEECSGNILENCDCLIATIGESWELSGEGHSSTNISLPKEQEQLIRQIQELNKPYACVGFAGRPLALGNVIDSIPALLWSWYPGTMAGIAVARLLFGESLPSGKLTMSFPRENAQVPIRYNEYRSGRPANETSYSSRYQDCEIGPLFPFGHGLSYADIAYQDIQVSNSKISDNETLDVSFTIHNKSDWDCSEISILFIEDVVSKQVRPVREMKQYKKTKLKGREKKKVVLSISAEDLKYVTEDGTKQIENGEIRLYLNNLNNKIASISYVGKKEGGRNEVDKEIS